VTITGQNDDVADGDQVYAIITDLASSADSGYNNRPSSDVSVTNTDNDSAGITVTLTNPPLVTTEIAGKATFTVVLNSQPTGDVTIPLRTSDATEGTIDKSSLLFTTVNWNA